MKQMIIEGDRVSGIKIGMAQGSVYPMLNEKYQMIKWGKYSYEYSYHGTGISLFVKQSDTLNRIFSISVNPKIWWGKTQSGLTVAPDLKVKDVISIYGKPQWICTTDTTELSAEYLDKGIYFEVAPLPGCCQGESVKFDSIYLDRPITAIMIGEIDTHY